VLPARVQGQADTVGNETLDVVTGTEGPPLWEAAFLRYGTVCKTTTIAGSGSNDADAPTVGAVNRRVREAWRRIVRLTG
jgi:hypothetical protein